MIVVDGLGDVADAGVPARRLIAVVLADAHALVLRGVRLILEGESDIEVVGEASGLEAAVREVHNVHPDVLAFDLRTPGGSLIDAIRWLHERAPAIPLVVMTMYDEPAIADRALSAGATGLVSKHLADAELPPAVRAAARGAQYLSPDIARRRRSP